MFKHLEYLEILLKNSVNKFGWRIRDEDLIDNVFCLDTAQSQFW